MKDDCNIKITTIEDKWGKATANYIGGYNTSKKYTKTVQKIANQYSWNETYNLVMHKVVRRLNLHLRYSTLNQLTIDWSNITLKNIVLTPSSKLVDNTILKHFNILITEPWGEIEDRYKARE